MRSFFNSLPNTADGFILNLVPANINTGKHDEQEETKHRHEYNNGKRSHKQGQQVNNGD